MYKEEKDYHKIERQGVIYDFNLQLEIRNQSNGKRNAKRYLVGGQT